MNTKRVRIAVVMNEHGVWSSMGFSGKEGPRSDEDLSNMAFDCHDEGGTMVLHFVEADIPVPLPTTIQGEISAPKSYR